MSFSFRNIVFDDKINIYDQIVKYVKKQILTNNLEDGTPLPSRRALAVTLNVNPNTIQKAYSKLEEEGIIETPKNSKSKLVVNETIKKKLIDELVNEEAKSFILSLKGYGLSFKDVLDLLSKMWEEN